MSNDKPSNTKGKAPRAPLPEAKTVPPEAQAKARLFRRTDWLAFFLTFAAVWVVYFLTLGPEVTLEDSGELVTGSMYAGIPHPPGYPVWAVYSWLWTVLLPVGNMAWRVAMGQAFSGAVACGLLALMVSRGSSMFMEGIEELNAMAGKWENAICIISGFAAGTLVGFDRFVWSESVVVNRIAIFSLPWIMLVLVCLLRWLYAPHQLRYAYLAALLFGVCITIHQSLIVAAIAVEVFIALGNPRMGRNAFLGNFTIYAVYMSVYFFTNPHLHLLANISKPGMFVVFNIIGLGSLIAGVWLTIRTRDLLKEWAPVVIMFLLFWVGVAFYFYMPIACMTNPPMEWCYPRTVDGFIHALTRGQYDQPNPTNIITEPVHFLGQLGQLLNGLNHEFTWAYLLVALVPFLFLFKMQKRERAWLLGLAAMYFFLGVVLTILLNPSIDRTTEDLMRVFFTSSHAVFALLIGYGLALTAAFMAAHYQRFRLWGLAGAAVATVLALYNLFDVTAKHFFGLDGHIYGLPDLFHWVGQAFAKNQYGLPIFGSLVLVGLTAAFLAALSVYRRRAPLLITLGLFAAMPLYSALSHWCLSEQHDHWFGYWFGHDMFTPPFNDAGGKSLYPQMTPNAILFGGTDPGRFCPTYMIFCDSFIPHDCQPAQDRAFDRRDVYLITQNALVDSPYLCYIRAQYNRSTQIDPPFFQDLLRPQQERAQNNTTNLLARLARPLFRPLDRLFGSLGDRIEKRRRTSTSLFADQDFTDLTALAAKLRPGPEQEPLSKYLYERLSPETRQLLAATGGDQRLRRCLAKDLNELLDTGPLYEPARFKQVALSEYLTDFIKENPQSHSRIRLNRLLLEAAYPREIAKSLGGVYPDREIYTPTPVDLVEKIEEYKADAIRRLQANQLDPGEGVGLVGNQYQIGGQVAVMAMNGLMAKVIFDRNPKNEFFVEESLPLKWMYPHLSPYGIIMKVNRQPLSGITDDMLDRDHEFWTHYSQRLIGDWITYDTPITNITAWVEKTYLRHNFDGFKGDRKFIHDDQAQKAFSKLRSAIAGIYFWRLDPRTPPQWRPKTDAEYQRLLKEADFALRQSFAFCPYSPEAVSHYVSLLGAQQRFDDAMLIAQTCSKLDPFNAWPSDLTKTIEQWRKDSESAPARLRQLQQALREHPENFQAAFDLASIYAQGQQTAAALQVLDGVLNHPHVEPSALRALLQAYSSVGNLQKIQAAIDKLKPIVSAAPTNSLAVVVLAEGFRDLQNTNAATQTLDQLLENPGVDAAGMLQLAQQYAELGNYPRVETALEKLTVLRPDSPETWYDLAALKAVLDKSAESLQHLGKALALSAERSLRDPKARDLFVEVQRDPRFDSLRRNPDFIRLITRPAPR